MEQGKTKILIAEDNAELRETLRLILAKNGYSAECVKDGYEALESVKKAPPRILILDLLMPRKGGIEILSAIKNIAPETRVIIYTAAAKYKASPYAKFADRFLIKAESATEELLRAVKELS